MEDWAQATIAATWRGYKQKKTYHRLRRRYRRARQSRNMQRMKRPRVETAQTANTMEREESVSNTRTAIQTLTKLKRQNIDNAAAVVVQSTYRRKKAYTQTKRMKKEARQQRKKLQKLQFKSATVIQALTRGRSSRRKTARQMRQQRIKHHQRQIRQRTKRRKAANNIQRVFRGYQCRAQLIHLMTKIQQAKEEQDIIQKLKQNNEKVKKRELRQKKREEKRKREESKRQNEWSELEQEHDAQRKNQQQRAKTRATQLANKKEQEKIEQGNQEKNQEKKQENRATKNNKRKQLDGGQPQQNAKQEHPQQQQRVRSAGKNLQPEPPQPKPPSQKLPSQKLQQQTTHQQKPQQPTKPNRQEQQRLRKEQAREQKEAVAAAAAKKKAIAIQRKKSRRHSSDISTKKTQVQTTPESEMQTDLTGLWTGEVCDSNSNVTQITDCVLRFYNDPENGQSMIEGRSKTTSGTSGNGLLVFQGVWDFNSSRFILVVENSIGKTTFMGWMKQRRPESAKMVIKAMGKEKARGVGHTLEGNAATGHIQLRKRENTRRAGITNIKKLINQAKDHGIMKRGNAAGRSSTNADRRTSSNKHKDHKNSRKSNKRNPSHSSKHSQRSQSSVRSQQPAPENQSYRSTVTTNHDMAGEAPMKRLTLRFGTLQASIRAQLNGAKQHMRELAGPLGQTAPEHMSKMSKDVKKMMDRSNAMGRQLKALETQLSLFGYSGVEENEDYLMCFDGPRRGDASEQHHNRRQENEDDEENDTECPASPLPLSSPKRRPIPLIASSVFEKLHSDFLPSSAVGRQRGSSRASSRASSRGSSMGSRSSSRDSIRSSRSRGHTPIASKRLAKFFSAATSGAEANNNARPGRKSAFQFNATTMVKSGRNKTMLTSLKLKSKRTTSEPSLRSLERIVSTPRAKEKHLHRRRRVQKGLQLDPMKECCEM